MKRTLIVVCLLLTVLAGATSASESPTFDPKADSENRAAAEAAGGTWTSMSSGTDNWLLGVWGSSASDVFTVGILGTILRYNGTSWGAMPSPASGDIEDVCGNTGSDVYAVEYYYWQEESYGVILWYNGSTWENLASAPTSEVHGIWTSSPHIFVVGDMGIIWHYNGSDWIQNTLTAASLEGVWGSSASNVFAVGESGTILRYNGSTWGSMSSGTTKYLWGVWGSSASNVFAVGENGTILRYNGSTWGSMDSGTSSFLFGVWGSSESDVFAVGEAGTILHYNGSAWSSMSSGTGEQQLEGVWGTPSGLDVFAVGTNGTILHYQRTIPTVTTTQVTAISYTTASSGGNVTSDGGAPVTQRGVCWSTSVNPTISNNKTTNGTGTGTFTSAITDLILKTTYHVRAYATNSVGTAYGNDRSFTTLDASTLYVSKSGCGTKEPCYSSIQEAVESAGSGALIKIAGGTYTELITLSEPKSLTLQGGWDSSFGSQTGTTILRQAPKAPQGSLTLQRLSIRP